ncbi:MAG: CPBP family intramembrane metalloprotease [Planctomycetes bacterium]|mgnify:CR=1 FL=1|nr:CPBP family intramembrane metalloprotease [Planctomycetota bacterium]MCB9910133.1 CPBP family intramembrane metalloprotease [Planctomycetota bacterium]MCB9913100.1 CPBP family intramembrane metalloprotease [Planctomycetota bacterium]HPF14813.1 CPBP family glutamic-type intramembrane protease [Planctomycetota bacterium]HRV82020.1 CPBP family glutamic-type intramembrane protease [Planctomycetota bacterium]
MLLPRPNPWRQLRAILGSELLQLVRDRRALFAAIILPVLLYPWLFKGQHKIEEISKEALAKREVQAVCDLSQLPAAWHDPVWKALQAAEPMEWSEVDAQAVVDLEHSDQTEQERDPERRRLYQELVQGDQALLVVGHVADAEHDRPEVAIYYDIKNDSSREAQERVSHQLEQLKEASITRLRIELLGSDPAAFLDLETVDVASAAERSGAKLGRMLPMLLVLLLISGGAFAALTVFAGERESGTLESILVQPIDPRVLGLGKFGAVAVASFATLLANLVALYVCVLMGWTSTGSGDMEGLSFMTLVGALWYLPGALLLCGLLCLALGRAKTFREGQYLLFPITLLAAIPSAVVLQPSLPNNAILSAIPFTGAALCLRDILRGDASFLLLGIMSVSHLGYTAWTVTRLGRLLDGERALHSGDVAGALRKLGPARHGMRWGFVGVLAIYIVGSWLQSRDPLLGLMQTLWGLLPILAIVAALRARKWASGEKVRTAGNFVVRELGLGPCRPQYLVAALLLVPAMTALMQQYLPLQEKLLPMPSFLAGAEALTRMFDGLSTSKLVFVFAISPGVCEELFFRGAVLSSLRRGMSTPKALFWQTLFFAAAHASIHRLIPTALVGLVLGGMTLRSRSIWPAILFHAAYDASLVLQGAGRIAQQEPGTWHMRLIWLAPIGLLLWVWPAVRAKARA